jgi:hypothetical protein
VPHCPLCGLEPFDARPRCPIDNAYLRSRHCGSCLGEVGWRDLHCGWCGSSLEDSSSQEIVDLQKASLASVCLAHALDGFLVLAMAPVLFSFVPEVRALGSLPVCLPFLWFYWIILWSCGRQSLGLFVMRLASLDPRRLPLSAKQVAYNLTWGLLVPDSRRSAALPRLHFWKISNPQMVRA